MKNKDYIIICVFIVLFLASAIIFKVFDLDILPSQFYGALIGVFITAIVTAFLLRGQTAGDEKREKSVKVFEKKQEVYHNFLNKLNEIVQNGKIKIDKEDGKRIDKLKELIFELGYLKMHINKNETLKKVFDGLVELIKNLNEIYSEENQDNLADLYSSLSENLFEIVTALKQDLYEKEDKKEKKEKESNDKDENEITAKMKELIEECELPIEKVEIQKYFWNELQNELNKKGYLISDENEFKAVDFSEDIRKYYKSTKDRHRYFGFEFFVNKDFLFRVEISDKFYFGFKRSKENEINKLLEECTKKAGFAVNSNWFGYKYSDKCPFDWKGELPVDLYDLHERKKYVKNFADEINEYIECFIKIAKTE